MDLRCCFIFSEIPHRGTSLLGNHNDRERHLVPDYFVAVNVSLRYCRVAARLGRYLTYTSERC